MNQGTKVLISILINLTIAMNLPKWVIKPLEREEEVSCGKVQEKTNGGNCSVSLEKKSDKFNLVVLGIVIHHLEMLGWALHIQWLWLHKTDTVAPGLVRQFMCHVMRSRYLELLCKSSLAMVKQLSSGQTTSTRQNGC